MTSSDGLGEESDKSHGSGIDEDSISKSYQIKSSKAKSWGMG